MKILKWSVSNFGLMCAALSLIGEACFRVNGLISNFHFYRREKKKRIEGKRVGFIAAAVY